MNTIQQHLYEQLAAAYVRGSLPEFFDESDEEKLLSEGRKAGLKLHRFKRTMDLPRVKAVLGILKGVAPDTLLDIGSGRGVFLWPLLDMFPSLPVTAVDQDERRYQHIEAVRRGGIQRLTAVHANAATLPMDNQAYDVVTALEVLEHQIDPMPLAREIVRLAKRFVIVSVPSKPDDNPEHVQLFNENSLTALLKEAGAQNVRISYVLNHIIGCAKVGA